LDKTIEKRPQRKTTVCLGFSPDSFLGGSECQTTGIGNTGRYVTNNPKNSLLSSQVQWLTSAIPTMQEMKTGGSGSEASPGKRLVSLYLKISQ
jgi:hypothetical protein